MCLMTGKERKGKDVVYNLLGLSEVTVYFIF